MPGAWTVDAECRSADAELFFPIGYGSEFTEQIDQAKAICGRCPVRGACLEEALAGHLTGIWGGTTDKERPDIRLRSHAAAGASTPSKPCSTCGDVKPLTDFYTDQRASDGRQGRCKACHLAAVMARGDGQDPAPISDEQAAHNRTVLVDALKTPAPTEGTE